MHWTACAAHQRIGNYWHLLPEAAQARKAIWEAINPHTGKRRVDEAFPRELRETTRQNEMAIRFKCGSMWQVVGSDNYNSLVGSPPVGIVCSEHALADPQAWAYLRPILAENDGWAIFITTPRGRNHAAAMYDGAKADPAWFAELLPAERTGVFTPDQLATERAELERENGPDDGEAIYRQEYECSFEAALRGAYYGHAMEAAEKDGRIGAAPWIADLPVHTAWDLGRRDLTTIWFFQLVGGNRGEIRCIDYLENNGVDISWYAKELDRRPYKYGTHCLPHDADSEHLAAARSIAGTLAALGHRNQRVLARTDNVNQEINATRMVLGRCRFDAQKCERGIAALRAYRKAWNEDRRVFMDRPLHDWASHGADAFRTLAMAEAEGLKNPTASKPLTYPKVRYA